MSKEKNPPQKPRQRGDGPRLTSSAGSSAPKSRPVALRVAPKSQAAARAKAPSKPARRKPARGAVSDRPAWWKRRSFWLWIGSTGFALLIILALVLLYFARDLPSIAGLETIDRQPGITIKTADGIILSSYGDVYGYYVPYEALPRHLVEAVMATEDRRFFRHNGIDILGIIRAMAVNIKAGRFVQGGSTVTQQVAKNIFLTPERTLKRKVQEMLLAFWLEGQFTKEQIMAIYLNRVYLGAGNFGVDAAANRYFDKPANEMNLIESAVITGLLKAPSRYSPLSSATRAKDRAHQVLLNMVDAGYLEEDDVASALEKFEPPKLYREGDPNGTRYFTDWIIDELPLYVGKVDQDIEVVTTLDPTMQKEAEDALLKVVDELGAEKKASQAALVSMTPDGAIRAMVGGKRYSESQFNRVTQAIRQPGSVFKLFVYLAALEAGFTPDTPVVDAPVEIPVNNTMWRPGNFDGKYRGDILLREALAQSLNTVSVQLSMQVGLGQVVEMAGRLGIKGIKPQPSIALGAVDSNLLDLTSAYAHLANGGRGVEPYGIQAIYKQNGDILYERSGSGLWVVLREQIVARMVAMLQQVPLSGTGRRAYIGRPMAGKTGTSSDYKDAWFIGFVPQLVTGVWVGNDNNRQMNKVTGGNMPAMIWHDYMQKAVKDLPVEYFPAASSVPVDEPLPWDDLPADGNGNPLPEDGGSPVDAPLPDSGKPQPDERESFWDNIFGEVEDGPVEYDYPGQRPR